MPLQPLNTLKAWFQSMDRPQHTQFWDWMDSFWHKNEQIPISSVNGLQTAIDNAGGDSRLAITPITIVGSGTITINVDSSLDDILIKPTATGDVLIGTTPGGSEIMSLPMVSGQSELVNVGRHFEAQTTIHITGNLTGKVKTTSYA